MSTGQLYEQWTVPSNIETWDLQFPSIISHAFHFLNLMGLFILFNCELKREVSPSDAQIHSKCFPVFWCCYVAFEQPQLDVDPASRWTNGDARGAGSPERGLI